MKNNPKSSVLLVILIMIALIVIGGAVYYFSKNNSTSKSEVSTTSGPMSSTSTSTSKVSLEKDIIGFWDATEGSTPGGTIYLDNRIWFDGNYFSSYEYRGPGDSHSMLTGCIWNIQGVGLSIKCKQYGGSDVPDMYFDKVEVTATNLILYEGNAKYVYKKIDPTQL